MIFNVDFFSGFEPSRVSPIPRSAPQAAFDRAACLRSAHSFYHGIATNPTAYHYMAIATAGACSRMPALFKDEEKKNPLSSRGEMVWTLKVIRFLDNRLTVAIWAWISQKIYSVVFETLDNAPRCS
jgi:hypothetical protein